MFVKALGIFDIIAAFILLFSSYHWISYTPVVVAAIYLIIKALIFFGDALSMLDGILGIVALINIALGIFWLNYVILVYLLGKGIVSMF